MTQFELDVGKVLSKFAEFQVVLKCSLDSAKHIAPTTSSKAFVTTQPLILVSHLLQICLSSAAHERKGMNKDTAVVASRGAEELLLHGNSGEGKIQSAGCIQLTN